MCNFVRFFTQKQGIFSLFVRFFHFFPQILFFLSPFLCFFPIFFTLSTHRCCCLQFGLLFSSPVLRTCEILDVAHCGLRQQQLPESKNRTDCASTNKKIGKNKFFFTPFQISTYKFCHLQIPRIFDRNAQVPLIIGSVFLKPPENL